MGGGLAGRGAGGGGGSIPPLQEVDDATLAREGIGLGNSGFGGSASTSAGQGQPGGGSRGTASGRPSGGGGQGTLSSSDQGLVAVGPNGLPVFDNPDQAGSGQGGGWIARSRRASRTGFRGLDSPRSDPAQRAGQRGPPAARAPSRVDPAQRAGQPCRPAPRSSPRVAPARPARRPYLPATGSRPARAARGWVRLGVPPPGLAGLASSGPPCSSNRSMRTGHRLRPGSGLIRSGWHARLMNRTASTPSVHRPCRATSNLAEPATAATPAPVPANRAPVQARPALGTGRHPHRGDRNRRGT